MAPEVKELDYIIVSGKFADGVSFTRTIIPLFGMNEWIKKHNSDIRGYVRACYQQNTDNPK